MSYSRSFRPEFFDDLELAREWYDDQRRGLGQQFADGVDETIDRIAAAPESFSLVDRITRVAIIHPFSYGVYFDVKDDEVLFLSVLHFHRRPGLWRKRR
jgi:hypothetical protein